MSLEPPTSRSVPVVPGPPAGPHRTQPPPRYPQPAAPRSPTRGLSAAAWAAIAFGATIVAVVGISLGWAVRGGDGDSGPATVDTATVDITGCDTSDGIATITYEVTNRSNRQRTVVVDFSAAGFDGSRVGTATAVEPDVPAGQRAVGEVSIFLPEGRSASRCKVDRVR